MIPCKECVKIRLDAQPGCYDLLYEYIESLPDVNKNDSISINLSSSTKNLYFYNYTTESSFWKLPLSHDEGDDEDIDEGGDTGGGGDCINKDVPSLYDIKTMLTEKQQIILDNIRELNRLRGLLVTTLESTFEVSITTETFEKSNFFDWLLTSKNGNLSLTELPDTISTSSGGSTTRKRNRDEVDLDNRSKRSKHGHIPNETFLRAIMFIQCTDFTIPKSITFKRLLDDSALAELARTTPDIFNCVVFESNIDI